MTKQKAFIHERKDLEFEFFRHRKPREEAFLLHDLFDEPDLPYLE